MIGNDGAALALQYMRHGTHIFVEDGHVSTNWRPDRKTRRRLRKQEWPAWVAVLTYIGDRVEDAQRDGEE